MQCSTFHLWLRHARKTNIFHFWEAYMGVYTVHSDGPKFHHVKGHQAQIAVQPLTNRLLHPAPKTQKKILMFFEVINCIHEKGCREKLYRIIISQYRLEGKKKKHFWNILMVSFTRFGLKNLAKSFRNLTWISAPFTPVLLQRPSRDRWYQVHPVQGEG